MFKLIFLITSVIFVYSFRLEGDEFSNKLSLVHKQQNYNVTDEVLFLIIFRIIYQKIGQHKLFKQKIKAIY